MFKDKKPFLLLPALPSFPHHVSQAASEPGRKECKADQPATHLHAVRPWLPAIKKVVAYLQSSSQVGRQLEKPSPL